MTNENLLTIILPFIILLVIFIVIIISVYYTFPEDKKLLNNNLNVITPQKCNEIGIMIDKNGNPVQYSPPCRVSVWEINNKSECINNIRTITSECVPNDAYGINNCTYLLAPNTSISSIGCMMNQNIVTCPVGSFYTYAEMC